MSRVSLTAVDRILSAIVGAFVLGVAGGVIFSVTSGRTDLGFLAGGSFGFFLGLTVRK